MTLHRRLGLVVAAERDEIVGEVGVGCGAQRIERNRALPERDRFVEPAKRGQQLREICRRCRILRRQLYATATL